MTRWQLTNHTRFAAERDWARDSRGAEVWLVAVKGTFRICPDGTVEPGKEQEEVTSACEYRGDPTTTSLLYDSDLYLTKTATDIILDGHAYAPRSEPAQEVDVTMRVGPVVKTLRVFGDRLCRRELIGGFRITEPKPFLKMPIVYERAFGGKDPKPSRSRGALWEDRNPVGTGFASSEDGLCDRLMPNIEYSRALMRSWKDRPHPAGFGPIAVHWAPRRQLAGTFDEKWEAERQPLYPEDFDPRFFQCSPRDQSAPGFLTGGESVELINLTPAGKLQFTLPRIDLRFTTYFGRSYHVHDARIHSLIMEPDLERFCMVWHTTLACHSKVQALERTVVREYVPHSPRY